MIRPSVGVGWQIIRLICVSEKQKYFWLKGLTGMLQNDPTGKSVGRSRREWRMTRANPGTIRRLVDCLPKTGDSVMSDDAPPLVYEGLDPVPQGKPISETVSETVRDTVHRVSDVIHAGRKPGMPLSILTNIAREAPLGSLLCAFLLGVAVARRR
jgi:hypothetical protein